MAFSLVFAFASGCKEQPPPPSGGSAPVQAAADKPVAPEAQPAPVLPAAPVDPASPAAPASPPAAAAPAAAATTRQSDKPAGASNTIAAAPAAPAQAPAANAETAAPAAAAPSATAAPAPEPPPVQVMSPKLAEPAFNLWMQSSGKYKAGQQGHVEIVLVPKGDYHCNEAYPYKFKPASSAGVTFPQAIVMGDAMSKSAARSVMRVPFVPANAGEARVAGKFHFSVCTASQCLMDSREVAVTVKVD